MTDDFFTTLYDMRGILETFSDAQLVPYAVPTKGNLETFAMDDVPVTVPGLKWVIATLSGGWSPETGKGFFTHFNCRASATVGDGRKRTIISALQAHFAPFELDDHQPEGIYTKFGSWEIWTYLIRKIEHSELTPLYKMTQRESVSLVCQYQNTLVRSSEYGHDFMDENDTRYEIVRTITAFEQEHRFLFSVKQYRNGYRSYGQCEDADVADVEVLNELVLASPPDLVVGTVLYDAEDHKYAQIIEDNGEMHLQYESSAGKSTWEPFVLSSRYEVIHDRLFEISVDGLYFDSSNHYLYRTVGERPNYFVVRPAHEGDFTPRSWNEPAQKTWIVAKSQVEAIALDYNQFEKNGLALMETPMGEIISDLLRRTHACIDTQSAFWVGMAVEHYGSLPDALHEVYFTLVNQCRHTVANRDEVTAYVRTLYQDVVNRRHSVA